MSFKENINQTWSHLNNGKIEYKEFTQNWEEYIVIYVGEA